LSNQAATAGWRSESEVTGKRLSGRG
jgi:hypothetical protein